MKSYDSDGDIETITQKAIEIYGHISTWDVSNITNFDYLFSNKRINW